jgi:hypothetical protein
VSSLIQKEEGTSLENQKQLGIKKAEELGFESRLWNEGGQSSFYDDLNNRPVLVGLLTLIESGVVKHLFVYNTDRLSRNQQTWAVIRYKLLAHGVTLHTASGQMNLKNPVDDLMLGILSEISQYDNRIRAERSRLGRFHKVQQGNWKGGSPPFGYLLKDRQLNIDPFESTWIKKIYDWYLHGMTVKNIQLKLSHEGVMTRRSNAQWSLGSIQKILRNPVYIGYFDYTDQMLGETVRIKTPAIVDPVVFQAVQDKRVRTGQRSHINNPCKYFYLLRDVLFCGHCGSDMGGKTNRGNYMSVYYCLTSQSTWKTRGEDLLKWKRGARCSMVRSINIARTDALVLGMVSNFIAEMKDVLLARTSNEEITLSETDKPYALSSDVLSLILKDRIDLLTDKEKKLVVNSLVRKVTVFFDKETRKHSVDAEFHGSPAGVIAGSELNPLTFERSWESEENAMEAGGIGDLSAVRRTA